MKTSIPGVPSRNRSIVADRRAATSGGAEFAFIATPLAVATVGLSQHGLSAFYDGDIARFHMRFEGHDIAVFPQIDAHSLARKHRSRKPHGVLMDCRGIIIGISLQHRPAC